jgi:hypothetical protein
MLQMFFPLIWSGGIIGVRFYYNHINGRTFCKCLKVCICQTSETELVDDNNDFIIYTYMNNTNIVRFSTAAIGVNNEGVPSKTPTIHIYFGVWVQ